MSVCMPGTESAMTRALVASWPRGMRFGIALAAGAVTGSAYEPTRLWPLMFLGIAVFVMLFDPRLNPPRGRGFGLGYGFGLGLGAVSLNWLAVLVEGAGPVLAAALIVFEALFFGLLGMAVRVVRRLLWWPLAVGLCWGAVEFLYSRVPFGGFGWVRLAYAHVDSPLAGLFPLVGVSGVSVLAATLAAGLAWLLARLWAKPRAWICPVTLTLGVVVVLAAITGMGRAYQPEAEQGRGDVTVGMVQGNVDGGAGPGAMGRARSVTDNHLGETITLMAKARAGVVPMPDFLVWPENSTDIDPEKDAQTRATVTTAVELAERPILIGAVTAGPGENERQTTSLWWNPSSAPGNPSSASGNPSSASGNPSSASGNASSASGDSPAEGKRSERLEAGPVTDRYHKRNLVPFGEYIPFRDVLLPMIPLLEMVGAQSVPGKGPGVLEGRLADGRTIEVGTVICFELAYDATVHEAVWGADVMVVQSNNATYRGTPQIAQQFAITRVRAMEARREIVVATTNAVSGHIDRHGRVLDRTEGGTAASGSYVLPLRSTLTPAVRFAAAYDALILLGAIGALIGALLLIRRRPERSVGSRSADGPEWADGRPRVAATPSDVRKK